MAVRALALAAALALGWFGVAHLRDTRRCDGAVADARQLPRDGSRGASVAIARRVEADCRGSEDLALAARSLTRSGHVAAAVPLTDEAIRRDPRNYEGWVALTDVMNARHLAKPAVRALGHVLALNPLFGQGPS